MESDRGKEMERKIEIICPVCKQKFIFEQDELIKAGYSKAIKELKLKLDIMEATIDE